MRQNYKFNKRILDKESDLRYVERGKLISAINCRASDEGVVKNLEGTLELDTVLPAGHTCIGAKKHDDWIYYFSTNNTVSNIARYNVVTDTNEILGLSNAELGLNTSNPIDFIDFLDDSENGKLLMFWTDGLNPPRYYDWNNPPAFSFDEGFFSVIKAPPFYSPKIGLITDGAISSSKIEDVAFSFYYRFIYASGQTSALSFKSKSTFFGANMTSLEDEIIRNPLYDSATILIDISNDDIESIDIIEVYAFDHSARSALFIKKIEHDQSSTEYSIIFNNQDSYPILSEIDANKLYDNVPLSAQIQAICEDRIFYGNYTDGMDNDITPDWSVVIEEKTHASDPGASADTNTLTEQRFLFTTIGAIENNKYYFSFPIEDISTTDPLDSIDVRFIPYKQYANIEDCLNDTDNGILYAFESSGILVSYSATEIIFTIQDVTVQFDTSGSGAFYSSNFAINFESLKYGEKYDYALQYYDEYNRIGPLLAINDVESPYLNVYSTIPRVAKVEINHSPPSWASKFKILRKEKQHSLFNFNPEEAKAVAVAGIYSIYLKVKEEDAIYVPDESLSIELLSTFNVLYTYNTSIVFRREILKVEITDSSDPIGAGRWVVIKDTNIPGYTSAEVIAETDRYSDDIFALYTPIESEDFAYKEISHDFKIENGFHINETIDSSLSDRDQDGGNSLIKTLTEDADVILSTFSGRVAHQTAYGFITELGRPFSDINIRELERNYSLTYSEEYNYETGFNGLSSFNSALINFKDYPREYGPIKSLYYRDTDIIVFQEDKVIRQPYNKNILESVGGGQTLTSGGGVLGTFTAYVGEYGMSNPESLAFRGYALFWVDSKRGVIMRLSQDGLFPISNFGMKDFFRELLIDQQGQRMQGYHDWFSEEYAIHIPTQGAWHFDMGAQGWTHVKEFTPDRILNDGLNVYSFKDLILYKHNELTGGEYNIFYGSRLPLSFEISINEAFSDVKTLHALFIEGDKGIVTITDQINNVANIPIAFFENKEGNWHSHIPMNSTTPDSSNLIGLGVVSASVDQGGGVYTLSLDHDFKTPQIPDVIKSNNYEAVFVSRTDNDIVVSGATGDMLGEFILIERLNSVSGDNMRGNYFTLKYEYDEDGSLIRIFAINIEANKSNV